MSTFRTITHGVLTMLILSWTLSTLVTELLPVHWSIQLALCCGGGGFIGWNGGKQIAQCL